MMSYLVLLLVSSGAWCLGATTTHYHTAAETLHTLSHLAHEYPQRARFQELPDKNGTQVRLHVVELFGHASSPKRPHALLVFGEHAREVITSEVALWLAEMMVTGESEMFSWGEFQAALTRAGLPSADPRSSMRDLLGQISRQLMVSIIPVENLEGRHMLETGRLCLRKRPGTRVDLNRNYPFGWRRVGVESDSYGGPAPFSEPQSRIINDVMSTTNVVAYVNVHSGESAVYTPWDSKPHLGPGLPADLANLTEALGDLCGCIVGPAGSVSGYLAYGTSMDYAYVKHHVPYPLTLEVYGGDQQGKLKKGEKNRPLTHFTELVSQPSAGVRGLHLFRGHRKMGSRSGHVGPPRHMREGPPLTLTPRLVWPCLAVPGTPPPLIHRLYEETTPSLRECFALFNPDREDMYKEVVAEWVVALMMILGHVSRSVSTQ